MRKGLMYATVAICTLVTILISRNSHIHEFVLSAGAAFRPSFENVLPPGRTIAAPTSPSTAQNIRLAHVIWSDARIEEFLTENCPDLLESYKASPASERAGIVRKAILKHLEGVDFNVDAEDLYLIASSSGNIAQRGLRDATKDSHESEMVKDNRQSPVTSVSASARASDNASSSGSAKAESGDRYRRIWDEWCTACGIIGLLAIFALIAYGVAKAGTMLVIYVGSKRASDGIELQNR